MPTFAEMSGDKVINIVVGDSAEDLKAVFNREYIEFTADNPAGIGHTYDSKTKKFIPPVIEGE